MPFTLPLTGRRRPDTRDGDLPGDLQFGDYWRSNGIWTVYIPGGPVGTLPNHHVEEHEDGTITVEPGGGGISNSIPGHRFHGWIRRGVWDAS